MPQEPKKRHSRQRQGKRRASISLSMPSVVTCTNCGNKHKAHTVCPSCGFYRGQQIIAKKTGEQSINENPQRSKA
ncbi:MAG: 50S ribosomal protein L32 [Candidatus Levybacteria bacterium]|nr:50S ribosomal protein L32 [Candidatus Levybacteria bacterium]